MESYSLSMAIAVRKELSQATPERLAELATYYQQRQGPGLGLLQEEYQRRNLPFPPACPVCGQQRNRCICLPWLNSKAPNNPCQVLPTTN